MSIDVAFLPSAGKGTRMGEVGKILPKPLWPLFETTLLGLQINYLKSLGVKKFYINIHHQADLLRKYCQKNFPEVVVLEETQLLGSGGALHNLKKNTKDLSRVIISNSDLIYLLDKNQWEKAFRVTDKGENCLIGLHCEKGSHYNQLKLSSENDFLGVDKGARDKDYLTYSGVGILYLDSFEYISGESSFFDTVVNPKINKTKVISFSKGEYWDFGTLELFIKSSLEILKDDSSELYKFILKEGIFNPKRSYFVDDHLKFGEIDIKVDSSCYEESTVTLTQNIE